MTKSGADQDLELVEAIAGDFYRITLPMPFRLRHVHVFALVHEGRVTLFDTGFNSRESREALGKALALLNLSLRDLHAVYITHHHADHCGMAGWLQSEFGATIHMSEIDHLVLQRNRTPGIFVSRVQPFYRKHGLTDRTVAFLGGLIEHFKRLSPSFSADVCIHDSGERTEGNRSFRPLPAPGHTRGQVCYYFPQERILLSGDHVLPDITPNLSPDLFCPDFHCLSSYLDALEGLKTIDITRVYPGHGEPFADYRTRIDEITAHHDERKSLILESIQEGAKTAFQVAQDIFGLNLTEFDQFLALNETLVHIQQLLKEGRVIEEDRQALIRYTAVG